jgi:hypothetical protein
VSPEPKSFLENLGVDPAKYDAYVKQREAESAHTSRYCASVYHIPLRQEAAGAVPPGSDVPAIAKAEPPVQHIRCQMRKDHVGLPHMAIWQGERYEW